ncbi:hypothetical protein CH76_11985 [Lysinibacillus sp. BF-4]|uniref:L-aspartate--L-methionine ligase LdmS n=1 Tax=Lysinibacillus sp. BF-4 TaxID=1473546 RepID=UPI0005056363|nr:hypothetical protein [Lysinibacillus sp. BF-4]KFL42525.1 hypothetical protein CH76_11985 [Lysinibacillus sp. BF-4]
MQPKFTLRDIYGDNVLYTPRTPFSDNPWVVNDAHQLDALTSREVLFADVPVVVHSATQTEQAKALFKLAGLTPSDNVLTYETEEQYHAHLQGSDTPVVCQYLHEPNQIPRDRYWMDAEKFNELNCKSYIDQLIDAKYVPKRFTVKLADATATIASMTLPIVLKPGGDDPTSGGYGVMICRTNEQVTEALRQLRKATTDTVVVEQLLAVKANFSCQYVYNETLGIQYLGASEQLTDDEGHYQGNVMVRDVPKRVIEVGKHIMECGVDEGFVGVAGFDLIVTETGDIQAIDLNFRQNGSTAMLMFKDSFKKPVAKFMSYVATDNQKFHQNITALIKEGGLLPLAYYDGDYFEEDVKSRFYGVWYDDSLEQIEARERLLQ